MVNGIEVLNWNYLDKGSGYANGNDLLLFLGIFFIMMIVGFLVALMFDYDITRLIGFIVMFVGIVGIIGLLIYSTKPSDIKQYQVTISDDVSMVEFNEKYDVISVEGKIWTIVDKE